MIVNRRIVAMVVAFVLALSVFPAGAFASTGSGELADGNSALPSSQEQGGTDSGSGSASQAGDSGSKPPITVIPVRPDFGDKLPAPTMPGKPSGLGTGEQQEASQSLEAPETLVITITNFAKLERKVRTKRVPIGTALESLNLPTKLTAYTDEKNLYDTGSGEITLENITWEAKPSYDPNTVARYVFSPKIGDLPEGYVMGRNLQLPTIEVYVSEFTDVRWENHGSHYAHFINSFRYKDEEIFAYGMNYNLNYAHPSNVWGNEVPRYATGYLTVDDFRTPGEYFEFIDRASKLLFAGYPNNGANLYELVEGQNHQITVDDFNKMLVPSAELAEVFPELKHHNFEYPLSKEENGVIKTFVTKVIMGDFVSTNGLDREAIMNMPFYRAATCFTMDTGNTPFEIFKAWVSKDFYVTKEVAYLSTQHAFSTLLNEYGIPHNDLNHEAQISLPKLLLEFSKKGTMATEVPTNSAITLVGEICFSFNPKDKLWYSEPIMIHEPRDYNGLYKLILPKGVRTVHNVNHVYADEEYRLVSDHEVKADEVIAVETTIPWLKVFEQFSPEDKLGTNGKAFEGMAGAVAKKTNLRVVFPHTTQAVGKLNISATAEGKDLANRDFSFKLEVKNPNSQLLNNQLANGHNLATKAATQTGSQSRYGARSAHDQTGTSPATQVATQVGKQAGKLATILPTTQAATLPTTLPTTQATTQTGTSPAIQAGLNENSDSQLLNNQPLNGVYGDVEFKDGVANFTLKDGESKDISYLPAGWEYEITAEKGADFVVESKGAKGIIKEKTISLASFKFKQVDGGKPEGGGEGSGGKPPVVTPGEEQKPPTPPTPPTGGEGSGGKPPVVTPGEEQKPPTPPTPPSGGGEGSGGKPPVVTPGEEQKPPTPPTPPSGGGEGSGGKPPVVTPGEEQKPPTPPTPPVVIPPAPPVVGPETNPPVVIPPTPPAPPVAPESPKPEAPDKPNQPQTPQQPGKPQQGQTHHTPQTGDNMDLALWSTLLGLSVLGLATILITSDRKERPKNKKK